MPVDIPLAQKLLEYYDRHARALPWRSPPGAPPPDPYRVWLSEIMLQQTTVAAVRPYFGRFTTRWPTVGCLAEADDADVMAAWAGLGYYARARNLLACARVVVADYGGRFPNTEKALRALPGIGSYTAAAIAAIAFGQRAMVVDGNVERVVSRLFAIPVPLPVSKPEIARLTGTITPQLRAGDFAQAMMDLGSTICTPRKPLCGSCPLSSDCLALMSTTPEAWPLRIAKAIKPERSGIVWWIEREGQILLKRRPAKGLLGGMLGLPTSGWDSSSVELDLLGEELQARVVHVFTHFRLTLTIRAVTLESGCTDHPTGEWWRIDDLDKAGLPTIFWKAIVEVREAQNEVRHAA